MWNHNLYKHMKSQRVPNHWFIPLIQGYVAHAKVNIETGVDLELVLIDRRRWLMGGTRYNARGCDEQGNAANCVESEQLIF